MTAVSHSGKLTPIELTELSDISYFAYIVSNHYYHGRNSSFL
jgi:hypothetical protein